jgi:ABC-2 type transport system permease protein
MTIHMDKLRWLLWLRWRLVRRNFTRRSGRVGNVISSTFLLLFWLIFGGACAAGSFFVYRFAPAPINASVLFVVLTVIYLLWILAPLMQISTNEGLDLAKLALFPLTRGELMLSLLLSTLLDTSTIAVILMFIAIVAGWSFSWPLALLSLLAVLIFYVQMIGMSQLVIALLARALQNRRLRDLSVIMVVIISSCAYLSQFLLENRGFIGALGSGKLIAYLQWLPPGLAAGAIQQAALGNWGVSLASLVALLGLDLLVLYLWQLVIERGLSSPETGGMQQRRWRKPVAQGQRADAALKRVAMGGWPVIPSQVLAIAGKDLKYFRRDPQMARLVLLPLVYVVVLIFSTLYGARRTGMAAGGNPDDLMVAIRVMLSPSITLLSLYSLAYNVLGFERQSLTTLFLFPVKPRYILWGKNLVIFGLGFIELLVLVLLVAFFTHLWIFALPAFSLGLAGIGVILACGNVTSVFLPRRLHLMQRGFQSSAASMPAQEGCLRVVMTFASMIVDVIVLLPVIVVVVLPVVFHLQWLWLVAVPCSLIYGGVIYSVVTALVAPYIVSRAPEILAGVARE